MKFKSRATGDILYVADSQAKTIRHMVMSGRYEVLHNDEWNESDHPRGKDGRFGSSGGDGGKSYLEQEKIALAGGKGETAQAFAQARQAASAVASSSNKIEAKEKAAMAWDKASKMANTETGERASRMESEKLWDQLEKEGHFSLDRYAEGINKKDTKQLKEAMDYVKRAYDKTGDDKFGRRYQHYMNVKKGK